VFQAFLHNAFTAEDADTLAQRGVPFQDAEVNKTEVSLRELVVGMNGVQVSR
jgi:hypothetical protein